MAPTCQGDRYLAEARLTWQNESFGQHHIVGSVANRDGALTCPRTVHEQVFALYFEPDTRIRYEVLLSLLQRCSAAVKKLIKKDWKLLLYLYINIEFIFNYVMTGFWTATLQRNNICEKISKIIAEVFVNRNANVVPLHRKNKAPACGRKNSHVRAQKLTT